MKNIKILLIGTGAREHAIAWKLLQSEMLEHLYCIGLNVGFKNNSKITILPYNYTKNTHKEIIEFCKNLNINLVIIGGEQPIFNGLSDDLRFYGINVLAPSKYAAQLESSKSYAKAFMRRHNILTAAYNVFENEKKIFAYCAAHFKTSKQPLVIKADGAALGKGVAIANNLLEAKKYTKLYFQKYSKKIIIEEFLSGSEISFFILSDGNNYINFGYARDYKTIYDNNKGDNSGGMGAYSAANLLNQKQLIDIENNIVRPTLKGLKKENIPYIGILFFGIILTKDGAKLLEYNVRLGDPEAQTLLLRLKSDLVNLLFNAATNNIHNQTIKWSKNVALAVVLANKGYPQISSKNLKLDINNICENHPHINIFYANILPTSHKNIYLTNGGRLLNIATLAKTKNTAIKIAYDAICNINFKNGFYRCDIGK